MEPAIHLTQYDVPEVNHPDYYYRDINGGALYSISVIVLGGAASEIISATERFELVSSLYGPGNIICWFLLLASVLLSWTANPATARRDIITNDFIAVLTMPLVAVAHLLHQVLYRQPRAESLRHLLTSRYRDDVRSVAAIEAPLAVCDTFIAWAALLLFLAMRRNQLKRKLAVFTVGLLCLPAELLLWRSGVPYGAANSSLTRPYLSQSNSLALVIGTWHLLILLVYIFEVAFGVLVSALYLGRHREVHESATESPSLARKILWPGRVSSWMSAVSAAVIAASSIWIKYGSMYPSEWRFHAFRFIPKSTVELSELDQVVAVLGGLTTLVFSAYDAYRQRKMRAAFGRRWEVPVEWVELQRF